MNLTERKWIILIIGLILLCDMSQVTAKEFIVGDNMNSFDPKSQSVGVQYSSILIEKIYKAMEFIGGYRSLDELKALGFFDREEPDVPKKLFAPSLKTELFKGDVYVMTLMRKGKELPWSSVNFFAGNNGEDVFFPQSEFFKDLDLCFVGVKKTDFQNRVTYTYKYQWAKNPRVFVTLDALPDFFIANENYPQKFYFLEIYIQ